MKTSPEGFRTSRNDKKEQNVPTGIPEEQKIKMEGDPLVFRKVFLYRKDTPVTPYRNLLNPIDTLLQAIFHHALRSHKNSEFPLDTVMSSESSQPLRKAFLDKHN